MCKIRKLTSREKRGQRPFYLGYPQRKKGKKGAVPFFIGFSLIELLVCVSILAIMAVGILSTFTSGLNVYKRIRGYASAQRDILLVFEKIERDIKNIVDFSGINFSGQEKSIAFPGLIRSVDAQGPMGLSLGRISYYFEPIKGDLVKEEISYPCLVSGIVPEGAAYKILSSIQDITFTYYYFNPDTQNYNWKSSFSPSIGIVPKGVRIEITFKDEDKLVTLARTVFIPMYS